MIDWQAITSAQTDSTASEEELTKLEQWIVEDPCHADDYVSWLAIHDEVRAYFHESSIRDRAGITLAPQPSLLADNRSRLVAAIARRPLTTLSVWSAAIAASLITAMWMGGLVNSPFKTAGNSAEPLPRKIAQTAVASATSETDPDESNTRESDSAEIAATLTGTVDCRWEAGSPSFDYGENLVPGTRIRLAEGLAQLTYECGAKVIVRGPSNFVVEAASKGTLKIGQMTAVVPRRAAGFSIRTPCAEVIDLGTEFAIDVSETGASQVHVFQGEVVSRRLGATDQPDADGKHLFTDEAAEYLPDDLAVREFAADESRFVREITPTLMGDEVPKAPQIGGLALWLAADQLVRTDADNRVIAWQDITVGSNFSPDDAIQSAKQSRPLLVADAFDGLGAIRFDGESSHLITTPMETTNNQTIFIVGSMHSEQKTSIAGGLLNYNGPPHRRLDAQTLQSVPGVLQLGLQKKERTGIAIHGFVYVGRSAKSGLAVTQTPIVAGEPVVLTYVYSAKQNRARLYLNGMLQQEGSAPAPAAVRSRKVIGKHGHLQSYFRGDLGELLIYNQVLSPAKLRVVTRYLTSKYGVDTDGRTQETTGQ